MHSKRALFVSSWKRVADAVSSYCTQSFRVVKEAVQTCDDGAILAVFLRSSDEEDRKKLESEESSPSQLP